MHRIKRRPICLAGGFCLVVMLSLVWWVCLSPDSVDLHYSRTSHGAVLLPNGQVLVIGGCCFYSPIIDDDGQFGRWIQGTWLKSFWQTDLRFLWAPLDIRSSCELFDPKTHRWTMAGTLPLPRTGSGAPSLLLQDGTVLGPLGELYENGHWTKGSCSSELGMYDMSSLPNGDVLGFSSGGRLPSFSAIYHPKSRTWAKIIVPQGQLASLGKGLILIASIDGCYIYDPVKTVENVRRTTDMLLKNEFTLISLADGSVMAKSGNNDFDSHHFKECEVFNPKTETWKRTRDLNLARAGGAMVRLHDGQVLFMAGRDSAVPDVLMVAGRESVVPSVPDTSCELYDPTTGQWTETGSMLEERFGFTATVLKDGRVLVVGGSQMKGRDLISLSSCEMYDPKTGTWSRL